MLHEDVTKYKHPTSYKLVDYRLRGSNGAVGAPLYLPQSASVGGAL